MCLDDLWSCPSEGPLCYTNNYPLSNNISPMKRGRSEPPHKTLTWVRSNMRQYNTIMHTKKILIRVSIFDPFDMQIYKFGTFLFLRIAPQPHAETLITTFPICFWLTRCLYASLAWSNEKTLSMTGLICRASKSRFISSNLEGRVSIVEPPRQVANSYLLRTGANQDATVYDSSTQEL